MLLDCPTANNFDGFTVLGKPDVSWGAVPLAKQQNSQLACKSPSGWACAQNLWVISRVCKNIYEQRNLGLKPLQESLLPHFGAFVERARRVCSTEPCNNEKKRPQYVKMAGSPETKEVPGPFRLVAANFYNSRSGSRCN